MACDPAIAAPDQKGWRAWLEGLKSGLQVAGSGVSVLFHHFCTVSTEGEDNKKVG